MSSTPRHSNGLNLSDRNPRDQTPHRIRYGWKELRGRGELVWLDKHLLRVDHTYQRERISQARVNLLAREFSWPALGAICVMQRADGSYWVHDGQHRVLAAKKRDDVQELPCVVFKAESIREEAEAFVATNTQRGSMSTVERFKGELVAERPAAMAVKALIEDVGYRVTYGGDYSVGCINAVELAYKTDPESCEQALRFCAYLCDGAPIVAKLFKGVAYVERRLSKSGRSLNDRDISRKLVDAGLGAIMESIENSCRYHQRSGEKVFADGIVTLFNKGRRKNTLPKVL